MKKGKGGNPLGGPYRKKPGHTVTNARKARHDAVSV